MTRSTPSIHISLHNKQHIDHSPPPPPLLQSSSPFIPTAGPMAIPHSREAVPPPLPPPQFIPEISPGRDPGWQWANDPTSLDYGRAAPVKPGSSLLGGLRCSALPQEGSVAEHARRTSSTSTITPPSRDVDMEDRPAADENVARLVEHGFKSERKLGRSAWEDASQAYDKQLVSRIGGPNTPHRASLSGSSIQDVSERERRNSLLPALGQPHDSTRWLPSMSPSGTISNAWEGPRHTRHSSIQSERHEQQRQHPQHQQQQPPEDSTMEDAIREATFSNSRLGAKRRASSPPRELHDRSPGVGAQRPTEKETSLSTAAASQRYHATHASLSSVSSFGGQRPGSLGSSLGPSSVPSSATSYASGMLSPLAASTPITMDTDTTGTSPSEAASAVMTHSRTASDLDNRLAPNGRAHFGVYLCECCPKKPKRFDTAEDLRAHEAEKQYGCAYCSNRFKNKNEAERHQNSLHLRRHSWSCAALAKQEAAFHSSSSNHDRDVCGYCGEEFSNPPNWKERTHHLTVNHKFGQCNQTKKFFRADHFRQHLKHSHDSTSGKWTNMLENACMRDEPPPPPSRSGSDSSTLYPTSSDYASPRS